MSDIFDQYLAVQQTGSTDLELDKQVLGYYLNLIRDKFQSDVLIRKLVAETESVASIQDRLLDLMYQEIKPGTSNLFEAALAQILTELEWQRKQLHQQYIVNTKTGQLVAPLTPDTVFQPPDFIDENGNRRKALPIVHPKITTALALKEAEVNKKQSLYLKYKDNPIALQAISHIDQPEKILELTIDKLRLNDIIMDSSIDGLVIPINFGKENIDSVYQSFNPNFNRVESYSSILTIKILSYCKKDNIINLKNLNLKSSSKMIWYEIDLIIRQPNLLS